MKEHKHEEPKVEEIKKENVEDLTNQPDEKNKDNVSMTNNYICPKTNKPCKESDYLEMAQRLKAEFENYKRRNNEIASASFTSGMTAVITKLLPALDSFQQAKTNIKDEATLSGVNLIYNQIMSALETFNVKKIDCLGKIFDPNLHNAVLIGNEPSYPDDTILEELQAGFTLNDKVIRHSVVKVNKLS